MAVGYRAVDDYMTKRRREMDKQAMEQRTAISQEAQSMRASIKNELADVQQELEKTARELAKKQMEREQAEAQVERYLKKVGAYERQRAVLVREIYETRLKLQDMDKGYQFYQDFQQGNERIARTNPEAARTVQDVVTFVMEEADMAKQEELARQEAEQEEQNQQTKRDEEEADL
jgi:chromosome segregation ATPase